MKIQSIGLAPVSTPNFQGQKLKYIKPKINRYIATHENIDKGYVRRIIASLLIVTGIIVATIIKEHKSSENNKSSTENVENQDAKTFDTYNLQ